VPGNEARKQAHFKQRLGLEAIMPWSSRIPYLIVCAGLVCLSAAAGLFEFAGRSQKVAFSEADCRRIQVGMTRAEVQTRLGMPPGDYATGLHVPGPDSIRNRGAVEWTSDEGQIRVWFDHHDSVERRDFRTVDAWKPSWSHWLRHYFRI
jgi:hypothetical protein